MGQDRGGALLGRPQKAQPIRDEVSSTIADEMTRVAALAFCIWAQTGYLVTALVERP